MKSSIDKLYKFFRLEIERGYDNHAVMGGLERLLGPWEAQARADSLPEEMIQVVVDRLNSYAGLSARSRAEALEGIWRRIQRTEGLSESLQLWVAANGTIHRASRWHSARGAAAVGSGERNDPPGKPVAFAAAGYLSVSSYSGRWR